MLVPRWEDGDLCASIVGFLLTFLTISVVAVVVVATFVRVATMLGSVIALPLVSMEETFLFLNGGLKTGNLGLRKASVVFGGEGVAILAALSITGEEGPLSF